ncbi:MAG: inositol monophosphatase family protein [Alphaproteobacteria bacterium]
MTASALLNAMVAAALKAGDSLSHDFANLGALEIQTKAPSDFVSAADLRAEEILFEELTRIEPGASFHMEERGRVEGAENAGGAVWIVDPLDGTTNFLHGIPHFAVSIGLERDGELVAGVVYNPANGEMFSAGRGQGAFLNGARIQVAKRTRLEDCVVVTGIPHRGRGNHETFLNQLTRVMRAVAGVRRGGSAALDCAWVAAGRYDAFWEGALQPWDLAGGVALIREAGGVATDMEGGACVLEAGSIIAGNAIVHTAMQDILQ